MQPLTLTTRDGVRLAGALHAARSDERAGAVVLVHGFAASREEQDVAAATAAIAEAGYDVVTYDARGHGESEGRCTLGDDERLDVAAAVAAAEDHAAERSIDPHTDRLIVVGASMGAIAALRYVVTSTDVTGLVTVSAPATWRVPRNVRTALGAVVTQTSMGRRLARRYMNVRISEGWTAPAPPVALAPLVKVPWAIVHGRGDKFIDPSEALELRATALAPTRMSLVTGMGHAFDPVGLPAILDGIRWSAAAGRVPVG